MCDIARNLESIRTRIRGAQSRAGRPANSVTLLVVTKTREANEILPLRELGVIAVGENRVQELAQKYDALKNAFELHFIGHLQTNKVRQVVPMVGMIQSVDSLRLARAISAECEKLGKRLDVLVEVNTSQEPAKYGVDPQNLLPLLHDMAPLPHLCVRGLMTMAMLTDDPEQARPCFRRLKALGKDVETEAIHNVRMDHLSMGMSNDFETAVEEGATLVRIGSALFNQKE